MNNYWLLLTTEQKSRVEAPQGKLDGISLEFANGRNDESEAHSAQALQNGQNHDPVQGAVAFDLEDPDHKDEHKSCLSTHYHKLSHHVAGQDLKWSYT